jgi:hypothetical protein
MTAIYGLYATPILAQQAFDELRSAGIAERDITIHTSEPLEEYEFGAKDRDTVMPWIAILGATIGLVTGYLLTAITQKAWAINTGGMPIVTNWSNLIVIFELTMLGAVFATVLTLLISARIPTRMPRFYDAEISNGKILVGVANPSHTEKVERALRKIGGTVRRIE